MNYASMSKATLVAEIEKRDKALNAQGLELEAMRLEVSIARRNQPRTKYQLPEHFALARDAAMRLGTTVKVTS